jgi:UDP-2-acetamido-2-deoxy-ribo-hexuluronate aminotransferase
MVKEKKNIQMVDLQGQYHHIKSEIDDAVLGVIESADFINGKAVKSFEANLAAYLNVKHVIACANGTDALQIALMALDLKPGDEVIVPAFTYVATAEVIALLGLTPVMVDVEPDTFNTSLEKIKNVISPRTKAIVPVHLFGQSTDMEPILNFAKAHHLFVVEDNAQAIGASYRFTRGEQAMVGTMGDIGCTSFFPSKNLGCYGDGGAMFTNDDALAVKIRMIANHGQKEKYIHTVVGCNSRLDTIQAAVLDIKLKYLDQYCKSRQEVAATYDAALKGIDDLAIPARQHNSTHVFHQYTLIVHNGHRNALKDHLITQGIPCGIYYPLPLYQQEAFKHYVPAGFELPHTESLCQAVLSLPIHTEMTEETQQYIIHCIYDFFKKVNY